MRIFDQWFMVVVGEAEEMVFGDDREAARRWWR